MFPEVVALFDSNFATELHNPPTQTRSEGGAPTMKLDQILNGEALFHPTCDDDLRTLAELASTRTLTPEVAENLRILSLPWFDGTLGYLYAPAAHIDVVASLQWVNRAHDTRPAYTLEEVQDDESNS